MIDFITFCDYTGTFAFAISGIRLASAKQFDWFGAYVVGVVTAVGGGTIRDILLNAVPFWMEQASYLIVSALALLFVIAFRKYVIRLNNTFFIFDAIGLGLFVVVGIAKTLDFGFPMWVAIVMGTITGSFGGMMRDILINEEPDIPERYLCVGLCLWRFDILYMYANFYVGGDDTVRIGVERVPRTYNRRKISYKCSGVERRRIIY